LNFLEFSQTELFPTESVDNSLDISRIERRSPHDC